MWGGRSLGAHPSPSVHPRSSHRRRECVALPATTTRAVPCGSSRACTPTARVGVAAVQQHPHAVLATCHSLLQVDEGVSAAAGEERGREWHHRKWMRFHFARKSIPIVDEATGKTLDTATLARIGNTGACRHPPAGRYSHPVQRSARALRRLRHPCHTLAHSPPLTPPLSTTCRHQAGDVHV